MTWGGDGWQDIPNGQTWDGWATGREWEAAGTSLDLWTGGPAFHLYTKSWIYGSSSWAASWTEDTSHELTGFSIRRGVRDWWLGATSGTATIDLNYIGGETSFTYELVQKVQITVDVPAGEKPLFTGFVISTEKTFNAAGFPIIRVQLVDHVGWSAQQGLAVYTTGATSQTGDRIRALIATYAAGYEAADIANLTAGVGLVQSDSRPAINLIDDLNTYIRGELGCLWVHGDGTWRYAMRGWWNPLGNPVATIGSLDRGSGGTRNDPSLTEAPLKFPATLSSFGAKVTYSDITWTSAAGTSNAALTTVGIGTRKWSDTVRLVTNNPDMLNGVTTLATVLPNFPAAYGAFDDSAQITIHANYSAASLDYCATADVTDFVEVAKETQAHIDGRWWVPGHVMGVRHNFTPDVGWTTTLELDLGLAEADHDPFPE